MYRIIIFNNHQLKREPNFYSFPVQWPKLPQLLTGAWPSKAGQDNAVKVRTPKRAGLCCQGNNLP